MNAISNYYLCATVDSLLYMRNTLFIGALLTCFSLSGQVTIKADSVQSDQSASITNLKPADINWYSPPEGYVVSEYFNGYINWYFKAAIYMYELDSVNYDLAGDPTRELMDSGQGYALIREQEFKTNQGVRGYYIKSKLTEQDFIRYTVFVDKGENTIIIDIVLSEKTPEENIQEMEESFTTINFSEN